MDITDTTVDYKQCMVVLKKLQECAVKERNRMMDEKAYYRQSM